MKIYISGPITGIQHYNHAAFVRAQQQIHRIGFKPINPHELCRNINVNDWHLCLKQCLHHLVWADGILMLPGWQQSKGATLERATAMQLNIPVFYSTHELGEFQMSLLSAMHPHQVAIQPQ